MYSEWKQQHSNGTEAVGYDTDDGGKAVNSESKAADEDDDSPMNGTDAQQQISTQRDSTSNGGSNAHSMQSSSIDGQPTSSSIVDGARVPSQPQRGAVTHCEGAGEGGAGQEEPRQRHCDDHRAVGDTQLSLLPSLSLPMSPLVSTPHLEAQLQSACVCIPSTRLFSSSHTVTFVLSPFPFSLPASFSVAPFVSSPVLAAVVPCCGSIRLQQARCMRLVAVLCTECMNVDGVEPS